MMLPTLENTYKAEKELDSFRQLSHSKSILSIQNLNLDTLKDRCIRCSDIYPRVVQLDLQRSKDVSNPKRVKLAESVAHIMGSSLFDSFSGDKNKSKFVLLVRITVVSDGCSKFKRICGREVIAPSKKPGKGLAKLTVSYCLYSRCSGEVAVSKQLHRSKERRGTHNSNINDGIGGGGKQQRWKSYHRSRSVLLELQEEIFKEISKEVKFVCCSRLPEWYRLSKNMLQVLSSNDEEECTEITNHEEETKDDDDYEESCDGGDSRRDFSSSSERSIPQRIIRIMSLKNISLGGNNKTKIVPLFVESPETMTRKIRQ